MNKLITQEEALSRLLNMNLTDSFLLQKVIANKDAGENISRVILETILRRKLGNIRVSPEMIFPGVRKRRTERALMCISKKARMLHLILSKTYLTSKRKTEKQKDPRCPSGFAFTAQRPIQRTFRPGRNTITFRTCTS